MLAIPPREAVEDADDPHGALRTENGVGRAERNFVEAGRCTQVARDHRSLQPGAEVAPRVLKQRDEVVGDGARTRVLKVQQTDPAEPAPVAPAAPVAVRGQPHQVAGVKSRRQSARGPAAASSSGPRHAASKSAAMGAFAASLAMLSRKSFASSSIQPAS